MGKQPSLADIQQTLDQIIKEAGLSLNDTDQIVTWFSVAQNKELPTMDRPRFCCFTADGQNNNAKKILDGGHELNHLCTTVDSDLKLYEIGADHKTTDENTASAIVYGMMAADEKLDLIIVDDIDAPIPNAPNIQDALEKEQTPLSILIDGKMQKTAAILGLLISTRMSGTPVALSDQTGLNALLILHKISPLLIQHCLYTGEITEQVEDLLETLGIIAIENEEDSFKGETIGSFILEMRQAAHDHEEDDAA